MTFKELSPILQGAICPYCNNETSLEDSAVIYGKSYGMIYLCRDCDAYVGTHKGTTSSLGRLANKELREMKREARFWFDKISKTDLINKVWKTQLYNTNNSRKAHLWLSYQLNTHPDFCYVSYFDEDNCDKCIKVCKNAIEVVNKEDIEHRQILNALRLNKWY